MTFDLTTLSNQAIIVMFKCGRFDEDIQSAKKILCKYCAIAVGGMTGEEQCDVEVRLQCSVEVTIYSTEVVQTRGQLCIT